MACNCGKRRSVIHQVTLPNGTVRTYGTAAEAQASANATGGSYLRIEQ